jgi:hypothetical protein
MGQIARLPFSLQFCDFFRRSTSLIKSTFSDKARISVLSRLSISLTSVSTILISARSSFFDESILVLIDFNSPSSSLHVPQIRGVPWHNFLFREADADKVIEKAVEYVDSRGKPAERKAAGDSNR